VWSSFAPIKAVMATRPSPPGRFSTSTGLPHRAAKRSANNRARDVGRGRGAEWDNEPDGPRRIVLGRGASDAQQFTTSATRRRNRAITTLHACGGRQQNKPESTQRGKRRQRRSIEAMQRPAMKFVRYATMRAR